MLARIAHYGGPATSFQPFHRNRQIRLGGLGIERRRHCALAAHEAADGHQVGFCVAQ